MSNDFEKIADVLRLAVVQPEAAQRYYLIAAEMLGKINYGSVVSQFNQQGIDYDLDGTVRKIQLDLAGKLRSGAYKPEEAIVRVLGAGKRIEGAISDAAHVLQQLDVVEQARQSNLALVWVPEQNGCPACLDLGGAVVEPGGTFEGMGLLSSHTISRRPPLHPNCLTGDTLVPTSTRIASASFRVYEGEIIRITLSSGKQLSGTPNHPILTARGWIGLGSLNDSDQLVVSGLNDGVVNADQQEDHRVAAIEDVVRAFFMLDRVFAREMPVSTKDFHNDGSGSNVAIIGSYSQLWDDGYVEAGKILRNSSLQGRIEFPPGLFRDSPFDLLFDTDLSASDSIVRGARDTGTLFSRSLRHSEVHALRSSPLGNSLLREESNDGSTAYSEDLGQFLDACSGRVLVENIARIVRIPFARTHVYNLQTDTGWFTGNGIVTHNCRCILQTVSRTDVERYAEGIKREAARSAALGRSSFASKSELKELAAAVSKTGVPLPKSVLAKARALGSSKTIKLKPLPKLPPPKPRPGVDSLLDALRSQIREHGRPISGRAPKLTARTRIDEELAKYGSNVNPKWDEFRERGISGNCTNCVMTYEVRRRGYTGISAIGRAKGRTAEEIAKQWGMPVSDIRFKPIPDLYSDDLDLWGKNVAKTYGNGARGVLWINLKGVPVSHALNFEVIRGETILIETQMHGSFRVYYTGETRPAWLSLQSRSARDELDYDVYADWRTDDRVLDTGMSVDVWEGAIEPL